MWSGIILLKDKVRVLLRERQLNSSQNVIDVSLCCKLPLLSPAVKRNDPPVHNFWLRACVACSRESGSARCPGRL
ncbi:hypothetical protein TNCV_2136781 [Trichonephila clavipes]|nr:hypothetical protein TNCV_2136781 [Trichonephila clavipes]